MSEKVEKPVNVKMLYVGNGKRDLNLLHKYYLQFKVCIYFENEKTRMVIDNECYLVLLIPIEWNGFEMNTNSFHTWNMQQALYCKKTE